MALNIVLGILVVIGTLAGIGLGYVLSIRGKREEWKKEYREKRILPLVDHVNRNMQLLFQLRFAMWDKRKVEKQVEESRTNQSKLEAQHGESENKEHVEELTKATEHLIQCNERLIQCNEQLIQFLEQIWESFRSDAWLGLVAVGALDEELAKLVLEWLKSPAHFTEELSDTDLASTLALGSRILARADEVIVHGGKRLKGEE